MDILIAMPIIIFVGAFIYGIVLECQERERRRSIAESQRERERQKREYIERKQKEAEERRKIQKPIDDAREELLSAFNKAETSIKKAVRASTVKRQIENMEKALSAFKSKVPPGYDAGVSYERAISAAKNRYVKMSAHEKQLSSATLPQAPKHYKPSPVIAEERKKLTPSMRYDVLNRDGHRCCICGRDASDGVKLHVDHIIPISKGGKTEMSNLRTLCADCNLGKGARIEETEIGKGTVQEMSLDEFVEKYAK